jgi:hypothetical protein
MRAIKACNQGADPFAPAFSIRTIIKIKKIIQSNRNEKTWTLAIEIAKIESEIPKLEIKLQEYEKQINTSQIITALGITGIVYGSITLFAASWQMGLFLFIAGLFATVSSHIKKSKTKSFVIETKEAISGFRDTSSEYRAQLATALFGAV